MNVVEEIVVVVLVMNTSRFHVLPPALNTSAQLVNICNNYKKLSPDGDPNTLLRSPQTLWGSRCWVEDCGGVSQF